MFDIKRYDCKTVKNGYFNYLYYNSPSAGRKPLLIHLHGAGNRGDDMSLMDTAGPIGEVNGGRPIDAVVVAPQCHGDTWFELFEQLLEFVEAQVAMDNVDPDRVYLTGVSMGAYAAWQLAMTKPQWFAALVPVCGGGMYWNAGRLYNVPIWAFHGMEDDVVLCRESQKMVDAVNLNGGKAKLTLYPAVRHDSWVPAFADNELWAWLFAQNKCR